MNSIYKRDTKFDEKRNNLFCSKATNSLENSF